MSRLTSTTIEQFFELEKEDARRVLRKEMDSAMDTIFEKMKTKLMLMVESGNLENGTVNTQLDLGDPINHEQQHSNDTNHITSTNSQAQFSDANASNEQCGLDIQTSEEQQLYSTLNETVDGQGDLGVKDQQLYINSIPSTSTNPQGITSNQFIKDEIIVKNEFDEMVNIIPNEPIASSSTQPPNENIQDLLDEIYEEDCDCPECVGGLFVKIEDDECFELFDESNDSEPKPAKQPRLENDQSNPDQTEPDNQPIRYITLSLKCPQCSQMYQDRPVLDRHLEEVHSIHKYRCLYKDCNRSFDRKNNFGHHIRTAHPQTSWPCGYCTGRYSNSSTLNDHHVKQHEEGQFKCSDWPRCEFVGKLRQTVHNHFMSNHRRFVCTFPACQFRCQKASQLKAHERTHRTAKPYRCKWTDCNFDSAQKGAALRHIRFHLRPFERKKRRTNMSLDANDYLEVVDELL